MLPKSSIRSSSSSFVSSLIVPNRPFVSSLNHPISPQQQEQQSLDGSLMNITTLLAMDNNQEYFSGLGQDRLIETLFSYLLQESALTTLTSQASSSSLSSSKPKQPTQDQDNNCDNGQGRLYFVDLAARHPFETSNTRALERGITTSATSTSAKTKTDLYSSYYWEGVCIEPNAHYHLALSTLRNNRINNTGTGCTIVGTVVADRRRQLPFTINNNHKGSSQITTTAASNHDEQQQQQQQQDSNNSNPTSTESWVWAVSLPDILDAVQAPAIIDYMSLDVEGAEGMVLRGLLHAKITNPNRYTIRMMTIEGPAYYLGPDTNSTRTAKRRSKQQQPQAPELLQKHGYRWICRTGGQGAHVDNLWMHKDTLKELLLRSKMTTKTISTLCSASCRQAVRGYARYGATISEEHFCGRLW